MADDPATNPNVEAALRRIGDLMDQLHWAERDVLRVQISERASVVVRTQGPFGAKQISRLIRLLEAHREVLADAEAEACS